LTLVFTDSVLVVGMYPLEAAWKHRFRGVSLKGALPMAKQEPPGTSKFKLVANPIICQLTDSDTATAAGITVRGPSPVLGLCRALVAAGVDPNRPLHAYRGDLLCLVVHSIGEGARLTVAEGQNAPRFRAWKPMPSREGSHRIARTVPMARAGHAGTNKSMAGPAARASSHPDQVEMIHGGHLAKTVQSGGN
jgi:hypothetical protein